MSNKLMVIMGPTAIGKTALGIELAKRFDGEVINGDSLQVYRDLDIGTAKVTKEEMDGVPHHLINIVDIAEPFTASDFKKKAEVAIQDIQQRGKIPILVGGSGLYIQGLIEDMQFGSAGEDEAYRAQLENDLKEKGSQALWNDLAQIDHEAAQNIHPNNSRRVIRALEAIHQSGEKFSSQQDQADKGKFDTLLIALNCDRSLLYERINRRVAIMLEKGVLDEARMLYERRDKFQNQAHKGIGYKEWFPYFDGEISLQEASEQVKQNSRRYAKRQLTWFRNRMDDVHWFDVELKDYQTSVFALVENFINREKESKGGS